MKHVMHGYCYCQQCNIHYSFSYFLTSPSCLVSLSSPKLPSLGTRVSSLGNASFLSGSKFKPVGHVFMHACLQVSENMPSCQKHTTFRQRHYTNSPTFWKLLSIERVFCRFQCRWGIVIFSRLSIAKTVLNIQFLLQICSYHFSECKMHG